MAQQQNATYMAPSNYPEGSSAGFVKPTLLAFHGSGSNDTCHTVQLARLIKVIKDDVNVESLCAPFQSTAGPGVLPFFDGCGPFYRWLPPREIATLDAMRSGDSTSAMPTEVEDLVRSTVQRIRSQGGRVIGLIGFSQGTKIVAGLLRASELRRQLGIEGEDWCDFDFGISICGSYPPPLFPLSIAKLLPNGERDMLDGKIASPTFHALGQQDEWMWAGKLLIEKHYEVGDGKSEVLESPDMGHHYPGSEVCDKIGKWMIGVLERDGVEKGR